MRERKLWEQVRPDFVVCSASVTVRRDHFAASQKLRREQQERDDEAQKLRREQQERDDEARRAEHERKLRERKLW